MPHASQYHFLKAHFNIILPFKVGLPSRLFPTGITTKNMYALLPSPIRAIRPAHLILPDFIAQTTFGEEYRS